MDRSDAGTVDPRTRRVAPAAEADRVDGTGLAAAEVTERLSVEPAVLADVAGRLMDAHRRAVAAATVVRRRSLTQAVQLGLLAYWTGVESHLDDHLALKSHRSIGAGDLMVDVDGEVVTLYAAVLTGAQHWLDQLARTHEVTWTTSVTVLARLLVATLDGVMLDFAAHRDPAAARQLLHLFSYQLAQHGSRNNKAAPVCRSGDSATEG